MNQVRQQLSLYFQDVLTTHAYKASILNGQSVVGYTSVFSSHSLLRLEDTSSFMPRGACYSETCGWPSHLFYNHTYPCLFPTGVTFSLFLLSLLILCLVDHGILWLSSDSVQICLFLTLFLPRLSHLVHTYLLPPPATCIPITFPEKLSSLWRSQKADPKLNSLLTPLARQASMKLCVWHRPDLPPLLTLGRGIIPGLSR